MKTSENKGHKQMDGRTIVLSGIVRPGLGPKSLLGNRYIKASETLRKKRTKSRVGGPMEFKKGSFALKIYLKSLNFFEKVLKKN
jgi:hypothetical protein